MNRSVLNLPPAEDRSECDFSGGREDVSFQFFFHIFLN